MYEHSEKRGALKSEPDIGPTCHGVKGRARMHRDTRLLFPFWDTFPTEPFTFVLLVDYLIRYKGSAQA